MKIGQDLILEMDREKVMMYSDLVEKGKLADGESGGHYQLLFCGNVAVKCPYDGNDSRRGYDAAMLMRESVVQEDLRIRVLNVPRFLGFYSGGDGRRPFIVMETRKISPAGKRLMSQYLEGMEKIRELGYNVNDTRFDTNHGVDENGKSIFYDFTEYVHEDWRLS